jgi:hypothetical protein
MALANRMAKELKMLRKSPPEGVCAWQEEGGGGSGSGAAAAAHGGGVRLIAQLQGPAGTVYEGGVFRLTVHVPDRCDLCVSVCISMLLHARLFLAICTHNTANPSTHMQLPV